MQSRVYMDMKGWARDDVEHRYDRLRVAYAADARELAREIELSADRADLGVLTPVMHELPERALLLERYAREVDRCIDDLNRRDRRRPPR